MKKQILDLINTGQPVTVHILQEKLGVSRQMIHRYLKTFLEEKKIIKRGAPPKVYYLKNEEENTIDIKLKKEIYSLIEKEWLTILASGKKEEGVQGFFKWCQHRNKNPQESAEKFYEIYNRYHNLKIKGVYLDATSKYQASFDKQYLKKMFYKDFYSIEIFGKTKLGQLVLHAKLTQNRGLILEVAELTKHYIERLIKDFKIDSLSYIPHSLPREYPLIPLLRKKWNFLLPIIPLIKITDTIPIAQKTLSKLEERITNAKSTIFIDPYFSSDTFKNTLIIDDAIGSGATIHESAQKIKAAKISKNIYGCGLVGSLKGFDVIREV